MGLRKMGIGARLTFAFSLVVLLLAAVAAVGVSALGSMNDAMHMAVEKRLLRVIDLNHAKAHVLTIGLMVRDAALTEDAALVTTNAAKIARFREEIDATLEPIGKTLVASGNAEWKAVFEQLTQARATYDGQLDLVMRQLGAGEYDGARAGLTATLPSSQAAYFDKLDAIAQLGQKLAVEAVEDATARYAFTRNLLIGMAALAAIIAALLGIGMTRSVTRPARQALDAAEALEQGQLAHTIEVRSQDEMGRMLGALERAFGQLGTLVRGIQHAAGSIDTAAREISSGNTDLSRRTEQQAASLEQTAASMEQLTSTVRQNAENARQANQLAANASDVATEGGRVVRSVVDTMDGITQSSARVAEIIGVIEGIAFQTNILALNAAVEAARAGEQGRGFSVVAAEVRSLAQRSSSAAKEIGDLINGSVRQVKEGARQVEVAGKTMDDIVGAVRRVTDIMGEITAASEEQSAGIEQVGLAIAQMETVTQQNAALVEEASAAAESLMQQAGGLVTEVARFDLGQQQQREVPRAPGPVAVVAQPVQPAPRLPAAAPKALTPRPSPQKALTQKVSTQKVSTQKVSTQKVSTQKVSTQTAAAAPQRPVQPSHQLRAPAVPAAVRPPVVRKTSAAPVLARQPATPAKARQPVTHQRKEPVLATPSSRRPVAKARPSAAPVPATADGGDWETF
ncbi:methyl-accepting chemotaxis protein [Cupriavidus metallidurans]|jgi:methyl-accepting chemotaxis protein-1 (serine sensor receptor)|uniref:methyl-accepting chemotaxis protein n=1 Tax=Cupriavidus TaxID=106589 RepID=UPI00049380C1|nr:methyl-accepting chemotaxis protein [Cupriavidus metallidurans]AVA35769.1 HAMP domain-containing protein [Cupriavidus metallidurans]KWW35621.1 Methyl-accepting chemotaxis protein I [Cupriavidus metallidurans]MDE4921762.1 methyl-accepting chemotaxis protein [Cupriavidus metallidurans]